MNEMKRRKLEAAGWRVGGAREFLGLKPWEDAYVEMKLALAGQLRHRRLTRGLTQAALSRRLHSSQSRVAKMEAGERSVSLDLLVRSLLSLGMTSKDLASAIGGRRRSAA